MYPFATFPHSISEEQQKAFSDYAQFFSTLTPHEKKPFETQLALRDRFTAVIIKISTLAAVQDEKGGFAFVDNTKSGPRTVVKRISSKLAYETMQKYNKPTLFFDNTDSIFSQGVKEASYQSQGPTAPKKSRKTVAFADDSDSTWNQSTNWGSQDAWQSHSSSSSSTWQWKEKRW